MKRKVDVSNATILEIAYAKTGSMLKAARVVAFVIAWGQVRREADEPLTIEAYAAYWKEDRSTAYRHQALFRQVFDRCDTPDPVLDALEDAAATKRIDLGELVAA